MKPSTCSSASAVLTALCLGSTDASRIGQKQSVKAEEDDVYWDRFLANNGGCIPVAKPTSPPVLSPTSPAPELCGDCWCRPANEKGGACPAFRLQAKYDRQTIAKYLLLGLPSNYDDSSSQKLCYPNLEHLNLPPYSIPIPFLPNDGVGLPLCDAVTGEEVCGLQYLDGNEPVPTQPCAMEGSIDADMMDSPSITFRDDSNDVVLDDISTQSHPVNPVPNAYRMVTYASRNKAIQEEAFITHTGACGYCSSAQDLGVYLNDQIDLYDFSFKCYLQWATSNSADEKRNDRLIQCMQQSGMTANCALAWVINVYFTSLPNPPFAFSCLNACLPLLTNPMPPNNEENCALNDCLQCDENVSGPVFVEYLVR